MLVAVLAVEGRERAAPSATAPTPPGPPSAGSGLRVVMDAATGEVVGQPTAEELGRLAPEPPFAERRAPRDLRRFALPSGAEGVALEGWADHALAIERGEDGSWRVVCSQGDRHRGER